MTINITLRGLCCANCAAKIEERAAKLDHVESVTVNFLTEKMIVSADSCHLDEVKAGLEKIVHKIEPDIIMEYR